MLWGLVGALEHLQWEKRRIKRRRGRDTSMIRAGNFNHCPRAPPRLRRVRVEPFEIFKSRVRMRVEIILSGAGAGQPNLNRGYPPTRKLKKKHF
ncbi:hypothetical protein YC2023_039243 [Brassica napus]